MTLRRTWIEPANNRCEKFIIFQDGTWKNACFLPYIPYEKPIAYTAFICMRYFAGLWFHFSILTLQEAAYQVTSTYSLLYFLYCICAVMNCVQRFIQKVARCEPGEKVRLFLCTTHQRIPPLEAVSWCKH